MLCNETTSLHMIGALTLVHYPVTYKPILIPLWKKTHCFQKLVKQHSKPSPDSRDEFGFTKIVDEILKLVEYNNQLKAHPWTP